MCRRPLWFDHGCVDADVWHGDVTEPTVVTSRTLSPVPSGGCNNVLVGRPALMAVGVAEAFEENVHLHRRCMIVGRMFENSTADWIGLDRFEARASSRERGDGSIDSALVGGPYQEQEGDRGRWFLLFIVLGHSFRFQRREFIHPLMRVVNFKLLFKPEPPCGRHQFLPSSHTRSDR